MPRRKILSVVGARPQFIKAAPVSRAIAAAGELDEVMVHTGQHFDHGMSDIFFEELGIPTPAHVLGIHGGGHGAMTGRMMIALEDVVIAEKPDAVLIYGDTNSTLAGALVAAKLYLPIGHVEAGLRSFQPMPEETNRVLADRVSRWLFCPTLTATENLRREGIVNGIHQVGDVMYDVAIMMRERAREKSRILSRLGLKRGEFQIATLHRAENTDSAEALARAVEYLVKATNGLAARAAAAPANAPSGQAIRVGLRVDRGDRPGRISRHGRTTRRLHARAHKFRGIAEERLISFATVHHTAQCHRMGRNNRGRLEPAVDRARLRHRKEIKV